MSQTESPLGKQLKNKCSPEKNQWKKFHVSWSKCHVEKLLAQSLCAVVLLSQDFILYCSGPEETERDV